MALQFKNEVPVIYDLSLPPTVFKNCRGDFVVSYCPPSLI